MNYISCAEICHATVRCILCQNGFEIIKDNKIKVFFDVFSSEEKFEEILKNTIEHLATNDVRRYDIIDIIDKAEMELLRKIYVFDEADIQVVQTFLK